VHGFFSAKFFLRLFVYFPQQLSCNFFPLGELNLGAFSLGNQLETMGRIPSRTKMVAAENLMTKKENANFKVNQIKVILTLTEKKAEQNDVSLSI